MNSLLFKTRANVLIRTIPLIINLFGFEMPPRMSACAIIIKNKKFLAIDLSYAEGYSLPGGGVNIGETLEDAITREVKEETNLDVKKLTYLFSNYDLMGKFGKLSACFLVEIKDFSIMKESEEGKPVWLTYNNFIANCAYKDVSKHLKKYIKKM